MATFEQELSLIEKSNSIKELRQTLVHLINNLAMIDMFAYKYGVDCDKVLNEKIELTEIIRRKIHKINSENNATDYFSK